MYRPYIIDEQFPRWKLKQRSVIVTAFLRYVG